MSLHKFAQEVASRGRGDDSLLIHMTPDEVQRLQAFAQANGRSLTINPDTGLPEAGMLSDLFKTIAPIALGAFLGPAGAAIGGGFLTAAQAGLAVGGITSLATGSLSRGLMAGLGAYGGAGLGESLMGAGSGALEAGAATAAQGQLGAAQLALGEALPAQAAEQFTKDAVARQMAGATTFDKIGAGFNAATSSPSAMGQFAKDNFKYLGAAAAPIMAGAMVPTTTKMPENTNPAYIRQKLYDPYTQTYRSLAPVKASEFGSRSFSDAYTNPQTGGIASLDQRQTTPMATGGIVALAGGGVSAEDIRAYLSANPGMSDADIASAMNQYGVSTADMAAATGSNLADIQTRYDAVQPAAPAAVASVPVTMQDNTAQTAMANTVADVGADTTQQKQEWTGGTPNMKQWMDATGITDPFKASGLLYGVTGSNFENDPRDWNAIMNSADPAAAARAATAQMYGGPGRVELTGTGGMLVGADGTRLTSDLSRADEFGIALDPAQLKAQRDSISTATPTGRAQYERIDALYQQALTDQSKTTGLATLANAAKAGDTTGVAGLAANTAAASTPSYTSYSDAQVAKWFTDNPTATNAQVQKAITDSKIDPAAVNRYIASIADPFRGSTDTTGGSGVLGIYNQMKAQGIDPTELYKAEIANDPKYAGYTQPMIQKAYDLSKGAYALSDQLKGVVGDKDWVKFMDTNKYSVNDMAQAFGLSRNEVQRRYDAVKKAEVKTTGTGGTGGTGGGGSSSPAPGGPGTAGTGGGGGGSYYAAPAGGPGNAGGSGIVIIRAISGANANLATFTSSGSWTAPTGATQVEYLVVAGGGGGGAWVGGGGGAGGLRTGTNLAVTPGQTYTVTVGGGGTGWSLGPLGSLTTTGTVGSNSTFNAVTSLGGGFGGGYGPNNPSASSGGSGGGGGGGDGHPVTGGSGTPGQGNNGGNGTGASAYCGGGGGGAGAVGNNGAPNQGGNGGAGLSSTITGSAVTYAGGGGGGNNPNPGGNAGAGGTGGGGAGAASTPSGAIATAGTAGTGGGGGGSGQGNSQPQSTGGNGGSGIVILRWS